MKNNKKETCSACGTSPINHNLLFFTQLINQNIEKVSTFFNPLFFVQKNRALTNLLEKNLINISHFFGIIRFDDYIEKATTWRSKVIWEEAERRGIKMHQVVVFGKHIDNYKAKLNGKNIYFQSIPIPPWLSQEGYDWVDDKLILAEKLQGINLPAPITKKIKSLKEIDLVFNELKKPIIVKPRFGSRGRHTTTNINTVEDFKKAYLLAREISPTVIAQEHLFGSVYRATVVDNILVGFFRGDAPFVIGDGKKNIKDLILEKNKNRDEKISEILINEELLNFIQRQNYTIDSVLPDGVMIYLLAKTGRFYGGYTKEMIKEIHPKIYDIFSKASKFVSVPVAGFDFIIEDPTKDPDTQHCGIIECNSLPFIDLHYYPFEGEPVNVAKYIWDLWEKEKVVK